jgi:hypothetical protein
MEQASRAGQHLVRSSEVLNTGYLYLSRALDEAAEVQQEQPGRACRPNARARGCTACGRAGMTRAARKRSRSPP